jgi:hypothetical protein
VTATAHPSRTPSGYHRDETVVYARDVRAAVLALLLAARAAHADATVTVNLNQNGQALAQDLGDGVDELVQRINDKINAIYELENLDALLKAFGNATAAANRGIGVDYATHAGEYVVGFAGTLVDAGGPQLGTTGVRAGDLYDFAAFGGANLARLGVPRLTVFVNGYYETAKVEQLTGHLTTLGIHGQVRALLPVRRGAIEWIGLDVTTGLEYSHDAVGAEQPVLEHFTVQGDTPGESRNLALTSTGTLSLVANAIAIPVIASTGVRLGALDVYAGAGADLVFGSTTITATLDGSLATTDDNTPLGTVTITAGGKATPSPVVLRALAGLQLDFHYAHVFVQGDQSQTASAVTFGLRGVYR